MYSVNTTPSQNVQPAKEQVYTREQLREDMKNRDAKSRPYSARPGETAWAFEKEQMMNQGMSTSTKKRGIRGLFSRDHAKGAEKEARKEQIHAEKAERFAQRSRDPALTDRERRKFLRKAAKQQASADFHESLKKKHVIGSTPGHKYQAVPAMATHHPIVHDNTTNTVRTTVNDQTFTPSRMPIGTAAFDGISEIGSRQAALEPHPAVLNVPTNIKPQQRWEGQVSRDRKMSRNQPAYVPTGEKRKLNAPVAQQQFVGQQQMVQQPIIQQQPRDIQIQRQPQSSSSRVFNDNQLRMQGQKLRKVQTIEKGGLNSFGDEWAKRKQWRARHVSFQPQQQREFVVYASKPALQRKATGLRPTQTKQKQGSWLNQKDLRTKSQSLRKANTVEKGGVSAYKDEFIKNRQQRSRDIQPIQQQRQVLPFGAADLQGINLRSRQQQRQALPFGAADLQGINLRSAQQVGDIQNESLRPWNAADLRQGASSLRPVQRDYMVGYPMDEDDYSSDEDEDDDLEESRDIQVAPVQQKLPFDAMDLQGVNLKSSKVQREALPFDASELQQGAKGLNESQPWRTRKLPFSGAYLREGARRLQHSSTVERNGMWLNAGHLASQSKKLNRITPRERGIFNISGPALRGQREMLNRTKTVERRAVSLPSVNAITAQRKNLKVSTTRERSSFFIPAAAHLRSTRTKLSKVGNPNIINTVVVSDDLQVPKNTKQARAINLSKIGQAKAAQQPTILASIGNFVTGLFSGSTGVESQ